MFILEKVTRIREGGRVTLYVITTIAQHPKGGGLHLGNLSWALREVPHRICLQTFREWRELPNLAGMWRWETDAPGGDPYQYHGFWDEIPARLSPWPEDASAFLFTQQDILFTRPIAELVARCVREREIVMQFFNPLQYYLFREEACRGQARVPVPFTIPSVFPRIWEGAVLLPASLVRDALAEGVSFGHRPAKFRGGCEKLGLVWLSDCQAHFRRVPEYLAQNETRGFDTMLELTLFAFLRGERFHFASTQPRTRANTEISDYAVHFHYPEKMHRESRGRVYDHLDAVWECADYMRSSINDMALHYHLSGAVNDEPALARCLRSAAGRRGFERKLRALASRAGEWMDQQMLDRLQTAQQILRWPSWPRTIWEAAERAMA